MAEPTAFGFLGANPAPITVQGSVLRVPRRGALSVVGGDITLAGSVLDAQSGRIQLASVASPGDVFFSPLELAPDLQVDSFARLGRLALSRTFIHASANAFTPGSGSGTVLLRAGHLQVNRSSIFAITEGEGARLGIDLRVTTDAVIVNQSIISTESVGAARGGICG